MTVPVTLALVGIRTDEQNQIHFVQTAVNPSSSNRAVCVYAHISYGKVAHFVVVQDLHRVEVGLLILYLRDFLLQSTCKLLPRLLQQERPEDILVLIQRIKRQRYLATRLPWPALKPKVPRQNFTQESVSQLLHATLPASRDLHCSITALPLCTIRTRVDNLPTHGH